MAERTRPHRRSAARTAHESHEPSRTEILINMSSAGLVVLALVGLVLVANQTRWTFALSDALFWGSVAAFALMRLLHVRQASREPQPRAAHKPATPWSLFAAKLAGVAAALWVAAQCVQGRN